MLKLVNSPLVHLGLLGVLYVAATLPLAINAADPNFDEAIFLDVGRSIITTGLPVRHQWLNSPVMFFDHTPLLVYSTAFVTLVFGDQTLTVMRAASWFFGLSVIGLAYRIVGGWAGATAGLLLIASPLFLATAWVLRMEMAMAFFVVLGFFGLISERWLLAGLAIGVAVMLKEFALAFWLVAVIYAFTRRGHVLAVAVPAIAAFAAWLLYAAWLDGPQLVTTLSRWGGSATGTVSNEVRVDTPWGAWLWSVITYAFGAATVTVLAIAAINSRRRPLSLPTALALGYVGLAVTGSFVIALKEPRWLIAAVPLAAIAAGLMLSRPRARRDDCDRDAVLVIH